MEKTTVLVVEDDVNLLSGIRDILELEDYNVLTATNGLEGLEKLKSQNTPPDVILSDITMPQMDGFAFLEQVRAEDRWVTIPFIFLTAKGEKTDRHRGALMGADVYLTKPFEAQDLLVSVEATLRNKSRIRRVQENEVSDTKRKIMTILNHEFRTPLTLVVAYAEMLKDFNTESMTTEEVVGFLKGVNSGADRLRRLVENFIFMVELENGDAAKTVGWRSRPITDAPVLVQDALRQVELRDVRPRRFVVDVMPHLPTFTADAQFFTIVVRELLDNAAKFSEDNSTILLTLKPESNFIVLQVTDEGRGIAEHEHEKIWQPFYQIEREKFEDQGAGSGLAIVDGVVTLHGWSRHVHSELGKGSVFTVKIPYNPMS